MMNHAYNVHGMNGAAVENKSLTEIFLNVLVEQSANIMEEISNLKSCLKAEVEKLGSRIQNNSNILTSEAKRKADLSLQQASRPSPTSSSATQTSAVPSPPSATHTSAVPSPPSRPDPKMKRKTKYLSKPRILYVGDSVAHNAWIKHVEDKTHSRITTRKAYSSVEDKRARWPKKNVKVVTEKALKEVDVDDQYEYVVLSAPTVDITNIDTSKLKPLDGTESFKQEIDASCRNMMNLAQNVISEKPCIKKVIILDHPNRYDTKAKDPMSLKTELAKYANTTYSQLWAESSLKHKIVLGKHNLECSEEIRTDRFTDRVKNRYDGVHMYSMAGRTAYTDSVLDILSSAIDKSPRLRPRSSQVDAAANGRNMNNDNHSDCAQSRYQNKRYSVPVQNKYNVLGN